VSQITVTAGKVVHEPRKLVVLWKRLERSAIHRAARLHDVKPSRLSDLANFTGQPVR
jgi:hypothetical protein